MQKPTDLRSSWCDETEVDLSQLCPVTNENCVGMNFRVVKTVKVQDGQDFELVCETIGNVVKARLVCNGLPVGYANLMLHDRIATLQDIKICDDAPNPNWLIRLISPRWLTKNYRGNGLGTFLLSSICEYVRRAGIKKIVGTMVGDVDRLEDWYRKAGFVVDRQSNAISIDFY